MAFTPPNRRLGSFDKFITFSIIGVWELLCSSGVYIIHVLKTGHYVEKESADQSNSESISEFRDTNPKFGRHWSRFLYTALCYCSILDDVVEQEEIEEFKKQEIRDQIQKDKTKQWSLKTVTFGILFKIVFTLVWYFLLLYTVMLVENFDDDGSNLAAIAIVVGFQVARSISRNVLVLVKGFWDFSRFGFLTFCFVDQ